MSSRLADGVGARRGELAWGCLGSGPVRRRALWAMLCVSVSIHSRRGALSVLPRTRCQTPLPPPSMLPPRGQPAEWRTSLPGCPRTCVSHTQYTCTHLQTQTRMSTDFYAHRSVGHRNWFVSAFLDFCAVNACFWMKQQFQKSTCAFGSSQKPPANQTVWPRPRHYFKTSCNSSLSFRR